jgi:hypothetical protein
MLTHMSTVNEPLQFTRSSFCASNACVEVAMTSTHVVVRNSVTPGAGVVKFDLGEWRAFTAGVQAGEFSV